MPLQLPQPPLRLPGLRTRLYDDQPVRGRLALLQRGQRVHVVQQGRQGVLGGGG